MDIKRDVTLAPFTTYNIGGKADYFVTVNSKEEIISAIDFAKENSLKYFFLGGGSNLLFDDKGFQGLIIRNRSNDIDIKDREVTVSSGYILSLFIKYCTEHGLGGMEELYGVPGTVGGAVYQNAGAYGKEICEFIQSVEVLNQDGVIEELKKDKLDFSYRSSSFQHLPFMILSVKLLLDRLSDLDSKSKLHEISNNRSVKPVGKSCGSFFKNPEGMSAGKLIEEAGFKGMKVGGAKVSNEHANYLINFDNASSQDIIKLSSLIKQKVKERFNILLNEEVQILSY